MHRSTNIVKNLHAFLHLHRLWLEASSQLEIRRTCEEIPIFEGLDHQTVPSYLAREEGDEVNPPNESQDGMELRLLNNAEMEGVH